MIEKSLTERMSNTGMRRFKRCYPVLAFGGRSWRASSILCSL